MGGGISGVLCGSRDYFLRYLANKTGVFISRAKVLLQLDPVVSGITRITRAIYDSTWPLIKSGLLRTVYFSFCVMKCEVHPDTAATYANIVDSIDGICAIV